MTTNKIFLILLSCFFSSVLSADAQRKRILKKTEFENAMTAENSIEDVEVKQTLRKGIPYKDFSNVVWKNWYVSVPVDKGNGKPVAIEHNDIIAHTVTDEQSQYFYQNEDGTYTFYTRFTGITSSGLKETMSGKYCRTELREYWKGNQNGGDNWPIKKGTHIMESTLEVEFCEGDERTIVAQIHAKNTEGLKGSPATVKINWIAGDIVIDYYTKPAKGKAWSGAFDKKLTIGKVDHEVFTIKLKVEKGKFYYNLICDAKGVDTGYTFVYDYDKNGYKYENYFKTGNYFILNQVLNDFLISLTA